MIRIGCAGSDQPGRADASSSLVAAVGSDLSRTLLETADESAPVAAGTTGGIAKSVVSALPSSTATGGFRAPAALVHNGSRSCKLYFEKPDWHIERNELGVLWANDCLLRPCSWPELAWAPQVEYLPVGCPRSGCRLDYFSAIAACGQVGGLSATSFQFHSSASPP